MADLIAITMAVGLIFAAAAYGHSVGGSRGALCMAIAVGAHLALAAGSVLEIALPASADTLDFHNRAMQYAEQFYARDWEFPSSRNWPAAISLLYSYLGSSLWLGYVANAWIYFAATAQLLKFSTEIGADRYKWKIILVFSLIPSSLLFANFLLRESFQILMLIVSLRYLEKYRQNGSFSSMAVGALALFPFSAIHNGFFMFTPVVVMGTVLARLMFPSEGRLRIGKFSSLVVGAVAVAAVAVALLRTENSRLDQVMSGDINISASVQRAIDNEAGSALPWAPGEGMASTLAGAPLLVLQFIGAPIVPFLVKRPMDLVAAIDTLSRFLLFFGAWRVYRHSDNDTRNMLIYFCGVYLVFCLVAAVGTTTVGTAMRHHLKVGWIIAAIGVPGLFGTARSRVQSRQYSTPRRAFR